VRGVPGVSCVALSLGEGGEVRAEARALIDYIEGFEWNCQYSLARKEEQEAEVERRLIAAYNLGCEKMLAFLDKQAAGCGDAGCVEHGFTGPSQP
jgi:hypothetical protein